ncbi:MULTISPECIES: biotin-dependent carboxyltransferase family protein [unclassified Tenacibaculum]|uniref:5-oxoprolinase subunit C family protein n=1 Tax=unclassified Tenacibaculum TaxID=2635139 RepID=UPI001F358EC2|nr:MULTISPECIES: biotin-dependent carboxyltransferase family protein [unclassified Tenacibaculum]MCF2875500.1 biotin-dependent carboxyltransferase family protein [Tenacibaculum sp. Cn5-1]MCF2935576.1 biotin-dependent carboxyltransferase family protein [Tenacibaculum sp. Cn5-34]MCG7512136.1 biotin-dependent carboxyltransferase family protein [Tenacibaculum sp. Cn5-46]
MIKVLASGIYSSIQDTGRKGYRKIGVPVSGVMDAYSAQLANHLLHNNEDAALIEVTFGGCKLEFLTDTFICITGADFSPKLNDVSIKLNSVQRVVKGTILSFGKRNHGVRTYIGVLGGVKTAQFLNSRSFYKGITPNFILKKGAVLPIETVKNQLERSFATVKVQLKHFTSEKILCFKGPEFNMLSSEQIKLLQETLFTISSDNSRMGYRLNEIVPNNFDSMLTSGVLPGIVQLTPSGKLIVLMRDCQVTGGYPRVLQLSENAINILAQKTTGDQLRFVVE